jgi:polysaccharide deacetylase family protein (PEP-CTERM system associated)
MTIDVEDYFQVSALEPYICRADWETMPRRVVSNTNRILDLLSTRGIKATFFVLGWVAERHPKLVRRIAADGHEVASHGYAHKRVTQQSRAEFFEDVTRAKSLLEDVTGERVQGYRAPSYSIGSGTLWALDSLESAGYVYSSSVFPIRHDLYGMPNAPRFPFYPTRGRLLEVPPTSVRVAGKVLPCGGGGWFRLAPYAAFARAFRSVNLREGQPGVFYFHPWEIDPGQPRVREANLKSKFRHYVNLARMEGKIARLFDEFQWGRMDDVFVGGGQRFPSVRLIEPGDAPEALAG